MKEFIQRARYFGVLETDSFFKKRSTILLNEIILYSGPFQFFLYPEYIMKGSWEGILNIIVLQVATYSIVLLNYFNKSDIAKWHMCLTFPAFLCVMICTHGVELGADYCYVVLIVISTMFLEKLLYQIIAIAWIFSCYFFSLYYTRNFPAPLADNVSDFTSTIVFIAMSLTIFLIIMRFKKDSDKHEKEIQDNLGTLKVNQAQIEQKNEELGKVNQELERFAYISSHNLKTPVRTIKSFVDLAQRGLKRKKYDFLGEYLGYAQQGAEQMHFLITDILEYSKINEISTLQIDDVNLNHSMEFVYSQVHSTTEKPILLQIDKLPTIPTNRVLINAVFQNLIENSIKYNDKDEIELKIGYETLDDKHLLSFSDNGIGIDETYHERIFEMFQRLHDYKSYEGSGIGLAMTKKIIEKLNGRIYLSSELGEGTTFFVELPKTL